VEGCRQAYSSAANSQPTGIATGRDRNLYFAERMGNKIGLLPLGGGAITEYSVPTPNAFPNKLTLGADGLIYFTEQAASKIGRLAVKHRIT